MIIHTQSNNKSDPQSLPVVRVTAVHKERYQLQYKDELLWGHLKSGAYFDGRQFYPTVGDWVTIRYNPSGESLILQTHPRKSYFARIDPDKSRPREQAVAANFDTVFILVSLNHDFNLRRIERYLALSWQSGGVPVLLLTKADLAEDCDRQMADVKSIAIGVDVCAVSSVTGQGLEQLGKYLKPGNTIVFLGSSGVGKSSLVNALSGCDIMAVNATRNVDESKGRHTTTHRQLITLPGGSILIDTPGMRELGMWEADAGLSGTFADVEQYLGRCRFSDCTHQTEPGCVIRAALENGQLSAERLESYRKLKRETAYFEKKIAIAKKKTVRSKTYSKQKRGLQ